MQINTININKLLPVREIKTYPPAILAKANWQYSSVPTARPIVLHFSTDI